MNTVLLAWVHAKYKLEFEYLYVATFLIDISIVNMIGRVVT